MYSHNILGSNRQILFQLITFTSTLSILCRTQLTKEIFLQQGMKFTLQCHKNNGSKIPSQLGLQLNNVECLSSCTYQNSVVACQELAKLTSNIYCRTGTFCEKKTSAILNLIMPPLGLMDIIWHAQTI